MTSEHNDPGLRAPCETPPDGTSLSRHSVFETEGRPDGGVTTGRYEALDHSVSRRGRPTDVFSSPGCCYSFSWSAAHVGCSLFHDSGHSIFCVGHLTLSLGFGRRLDAAVPLMQYRSTSCGPQSLLFFLLSAPRANQPDAYLVVVEKEAFDSNLVLIGARVLTFPSYSRNAAAHWVCVTSTFPSPRLCFCVDTSSCGVEHFSPAPYRAPKRRIGGSGTSAGFGHMQLRPQHGEPSFSFRWLDSFEEPVAFFTDWLVWAVVLMQQWTLAVLCPFFRHLALIFLWALIGLLFRPFRNCTAPLSGLALLPTRGLPPALLCFAAVYLVEQQQMQTTQAWLRHGARRPKRQRRTFVGIRGPWPSASLCSWLWSSLLLGLPSQVWAAPSSLHELASGAQHSAELHPEHLTNAEQSGDCTEPRRVQDDLRASLLHHAISHDLGRPLADTDELPVPPLHLPPEVGSAQEPTVEGFCFALAPRYQAEVLKLTLRPPLDLATFISAAREAVLHLRLPFCFVIAPTFPQLGPDFASIVLAPKWLPQAGKQLVVFDFRAMDDGPVYARLTYNRVSHQECEQEAVYQGFRNTSIYVQGHSRALEAGDTFLAVLGCVVQFQPRDRPAQWCSTLADRFDRPQGWSANPHLPAFPRDRPVLALHHEHSTLYSASRFPGAPTLGFLAGLVDRTSERTLYISPPSSALTNIDFRGAACRDVLAVFPLTPVPDRIGIIVFLDPRQADKEVTHVYLPSGTTDPQFLVRFLALRPPPCYRVAILPRPGRAGLLHLSEGDIVTFGYKEDHPWSTEDDSSSSQEAAESAPDHTSDAEVADEDAADNMLAAMPAPRGPPPPVPVTSQHSPSQVSERARTRSPRPNRDSAPSRPAPPGSGSALAASLLGVTLGLSQPGAAEGSLNAPVCPTTSLPATIGMLQAVLQYGVLVCVAFVVLRRIQRGLCHVPAPASATSGTDPQVTFKLLAEPAGRTHIETRMLQRLRAATRRLGGRWITDPPLHLQGLMPLQPADEGPSDFDASEDFQTVPCIILCPEYTAELADIHISLPATVDEVTDALHTARMSARAVAFPRLVPVLPQPSHGLAAFIAYPAWHFNDVLVCIDTVAIDGRLFATRSPAYVRKSDLIRLAGLLPGLDYDVFYNVDQEPLGDRPIYLFPGVLITFLHPGSLWPAQYDLATLLQSHLAWEDITAPPIPRYADAYCLVHDEVATLCVDAGRYPVRYRDTIAYATGVDPSRMRLFAAAPHPGDSTLQGVPCETVLAVGLPPMHNPDSVWHYALLDCRPLLASWRTLCVPNGYVLQRLLFADLAKHVPLGWELRIDGRRETSGVLWFVPGQVAVVTAAQPVDHPDGPPHGNRATPPDRGFPSSADAPEATNSTQQAPSADADSHIHAPDSVASSREETSSSAAELATVVFELHMLDYDTETVAVHLPMPCGLSSALQQLSSTRDAARRHIFPRLFPASHQPAAAPCQVIAAPAWDSSGVFVLVENGFAGNRLFAALAPPLSHRRLLLGLLDAPVPFDTYVYVRDTPWPLGNDVTVQLEPGDFVSFQPATHEYAVLTTVSDLLLDRDSRQFAAARPDQEGQASRLRTHDAGQLWLLSDGWPRRLPFDRSRSNLLRRDIAGVLHIPEPELRVRPCRSGLADLSVRGFPISATLIATSLDIRLTDAGRGLFPYVLDMRPVLLGVEWGANSAGYINLRELDRRLANRCPAGYRVLCQGGRPEPRLYSISCVSAPARFLSFLSSIPQLLFGTIWILV